MGEAVDVDEGGSWGARLMRWSGIGILALAVGFAVRGPGASVAVGQPSPPLRLATLDGRRADLGAYRGKPMLLNFFATWCGPCRGEISVLNKLAAELKDRVAITGVLVFSGAPGDDTTRAVASLGPAYPVWVTDDETAAAWRVSAVPVSVILDGAGTVRWVTNGAVSEEEVRDALANLRL